jgi:hypothetical protein
MLGRSKYWLPSYYTGVQGQNIQNPDFRLRGINASVQQVLTVLPESLERVRSEAKSGGSRERYSALIVIVIGSITLANGQVRYIYPAVSRLSQVDRCNALRVRSPLPSTKILAGLSPSLLYLCLSVCFCLYSQCWAATY